MNMRKLIMNRSFSIIINAPVVTIVEAKKENIIDENDTNRLSNLLKPIDNFSLKYYKKDYTFEDFVKDKELKQNVSFNLFQKDDESGSDQSDEFNMIPSDDEEKINKMVLLFKIRI